jgi:hypothetical protein
MPHVSRMQCKRTMVMCAITWACGGEPSPATPTSSERVPSLDGVWRFEVVVDAADAPWGWPDPETLRHPLGRIWPSELEPLRGWMQPLLESHLVPERVRAFVDLLESARDASARLRLSGPMTVEAGWARWSPLRLEGGADCPANWMLPFEGIHAPVAPAGDGLRFEGRTSWPAGEIRDALLDDLARCVGAEDLKALLDEALECTRVRELIPDPILAPVAVQVCELAERMLEADFLPIEGETETWRWEFRLHDAEAGFAGPRSLMVRALPRDRSVPSTWSVAPQ